MNEHIHVCTYTGHTCICTCMCLYSRHEHVEHAVCKGTVCMHVCVCVEMCVYCGYISDVGGSRVECKEEVSVGRFPQRHLSCSYWTFTLWDKLTVFKSRVFGMRTAEGHSMAPCLRNKPLCEEGCTGLPSVWAFTPRLMVFVLFCRTPISLGDQHPLPQPQTLAHPLPPPFERFSFVNH